MSLTLLVLCLLFVADILSLRGNPDTAQQQARKIVAESLAVQLSTIVYVADEHALQHAVSEFVKRNENIVSASLTRASGRVLAKEQSHRQAEVLDSFSSASILEVPIFEGSTKWGNVEVVFRPVSRLRADIVHFGFLVVGSFLLFIVFLRRALMQLDPSRAVPGRVNTAFNLFSEGVVILDSELRVMLANQSAADMVDAKPDVLIGKSLDNWPWVKGDAWQAPWVTAFQTSMGVSEQNLYLETKGENRLIVVSCSLVGVEDPSRSGVMVTLNDRSAMQKKNQELSIAVHKYKEAEKTLSQKNRELETLAWSDPLTGLLNRRKLMESFEELLATAVSQKQPLACLMLDIDFFKAINDNYGHAVGDEVIIAVASTLKSCSREADIVGRYGGEEFVLVMPDTTLSCSLELAERLRAAVQSLSEDESVSVSRVTASMGVADVMVEAGNDDINAMLDRADKALYVAKESGRNRVIAYDPAASPLESDNAEESVKPIGSSTLSKETSPEVVSESVSTVKNGQQSPRPMALMQSQSVDAVQTVVHGGKEEIKPLESRVQATNLPHRELFMHAVSIEIARADRKNQSFGVISIEVKDLESLVSNLGYEVCDQVIKEVLDKIQEDLRVTDIVARINDEHSVSHLAENEYGILLTDLSESNHALPIVLRIRRLLLKPQLVGGKNVYPGFNIGIALYPDLNADAAQLLEAATDARKTAAKKPDKASYIFASADMQQMSREYIQLESDLCKAVSNGEMGVYFQPTFDMETRSINSVEALVRWEHPTRGDIPPADFISLAESNGLIRDIFNHVLECSLEQLNAWDDLGLAIERVSVNLSSAQLRDEELATQILGVLKKAKLSPERLGVELTENSIIQSSEKARKSLGRLHDSGVTVSMDDFGTGYTSLGLLAELPLGSVKIDRSFILAMQTSERSRAIVESVINMAHALRLSVVAEGVETNEQLMTLDALGCNQVQGFLISRALPGSEITALLKRENMRAYRKAI